MYMNQIYLSYSCIKEINVAASSKMTLKTIFNSTIMLILLILLGNQGVASDNSWMIFDDSQVAEIHITVDPVILEWLYVDTNLYSDSLHPAKFNFKNRYINETVENIGFRLRGNTSRASAKKSFKISFNTFVPGREFYGLDKINLNGEHNDPSIIRTKICWDLFNDIGMTASRSAHAAVYINDEYYGLYISVEHVDDEFVDKRYNDPPGNLWKCLWPADLVYRGSNPEDYHPYYDEKRPYELKTNEEEYDFSELARFINILNNTPDSDFVDSIEQIIVVPEVLKYFAVNILTGSWDDYRFLKNNYYLYNEPSIDKFHLIPYDYDNTFGIDWFSTDWSTVDPYDYPALDDSGRPLTRLLDVPEYRNLFTHFLEFYSTNVTQLALIESRIDSIKELITPWAEADFYRTYDYEFSIADFHQSYSSDHYSNQHVKNGLKEFIQQRNISLSSQLNYIESEPIVYNLDRLPRIPYPGDSIKIDAAVFSLDVLSEINILFHPGNLTVIESYPMAYNPVADTKIIEQADRWTGVLPPLGEGGFGRFQISVLDKDGSLYLFPDRDFIFIHTLELQDIPLKINEFLAGNETTNTDDSGEYDDWIELINTGNQAIALGGLYLTDNPNNLTKWQFPFGGELLEPGAFLLVWCDEEQEQIVCHTNFKLSAGGEYIAIAAEDGTTIIDSLNFGEQETDISLGRFPDGGDTWQQYEIPTPGLSNQSQTDINLNPLINGFRLKQNYPNPFNVATTIKYVLDKKTTVRLDILNINGQFLKTLYEGDQAAGEYHIYWNAAGLGSGIYFCVLQTDNYRNIVKMILLK